MSESNFSQRVEPASDAWNVSTTTRKGINAFKKASILQQKELEELAKELADIAAGKSTTERTHAEVEEELCEKILNIVLPSKAHLHDARKSQRGEYAAAFKTLPAQIEFMDSLLTETGGDERAAGVAAAMGRLESLKGMHDYVIELGQKASTDIFRLPR